jgi:cbb3-type cytochrome oxidase subunit 3
MGPDYVQWALMIATVLAFAVVIAALIWIYNKSKKNRGEE